MKNRIRFAGRISRAGKPRTPGACVYSCRRFGDPAREADPALLGHIK